MPGRNLVIALMLFVLLSSQSFADDKDAAIRAMQDELSRAGGMKFDNFDPPYFVSYQLLDSRTEVISARFGAVFNDYTRKQRAIWAEVRVGDYALDSSGKAEFQAAFDPEVDYNDTSRQFYGPGDKNTDALRGQLWLATDQAYKNALSRFMNKKGKKIYKADPKRSEQFADFSRETPHTYRGPDMKLTPDKEAWRGFLRELTNELKNDSGLLESDAQVSFETETRYFANTEGTLIVDDATLFTFFVSARALAEDGMELQHSVVRYASSAEGIPSFDELKKATRRMVSEIQQLRKAPVIDPYTGPAILDALTTGVFFHEAIGHRLEGERMRDMQEGQTFKGKVGEEILPSFVSLYDDPGVAEFKGVELNGHYLFDNEGVPAQKTMLSQNGILKNFLMSRAPIPGFDKSNGHARGDGLRDPTSRMANLFVSSSKTVSHDELKRMLIREVKKQGKPYGLILKLSRGGETATGRVDFQAFANKPTLIYKVDPKTGAETLVRGAELVGTPLISISKITATDDSPEVFNGFCGAESGLVPVSAIAPAALVSEIELQRSSAQPKRQPILPPPWEK
jgi:TldD protein